MGDLPGDGMADELTDGNTQRPIPGMEGTAESEPDTDVDIPEDLFDVIVGHDDLKRIFLSSLRAWKPVHILLVGPPATAKSVFLSELEHLPGSRYALGGTSSRAGIVDFILKHRPRYLLIDELDKMNMSDYSALLTLMETGQVTRLKKRMNDAIRVKVWVFAAVNRDSKLPTELKSRFFSYYVHEYGEQEFIKVARNVLVKREHVTEEAAGSIADRVARHSRDVRDAIKIARLYSGKDPNMSIDDLVRLAFSHRRTRGELL